MIKVFALLEKRRELERVKKEKPNLWTGYLVDASTEVKSYCESIVANDSWRIKSHTQLKEEP